LPKFYLDAGHGGKDSGAIGNGLYEKNIVLDLAKRVETRLKEYKNVEIMQTRTTDTFLELSERTTKANRWGADVFISFHCNANPSTAPRGFESFIYNGSVGSDTIALQNVLHQEIIRQIANTGIVDRGKKRANFHILRESHMKSILVENLFVSNSTDAALLKKDSFLDKLADGYANGLEKFFGLERTIRPPTDDDALYQVIAGTFSNYENAEEQVKKLAASGYKAYIIKK
jgi:N-acetylmuramoyl-L-alanine amidase